ncbi:MAG: ATP-binding protein [Congregibacter sp.]
MSLSIKQKLLIALVGLTAVVLIATLGLARWSFQQGFLDYVNALELRRLQSLQQELATQYQAQGENWDSITEASFGNLLRRSSRSSDSPPPAQPATRSTAGPSRGPGPGQGPENRPRRPPGAGTAPTALYDIDGKRIAGPVLDVALQKPVQGILQTEAPTLTRLNIVASGRIIGELRSEPRRLIDSPLETAFSRQQLKTSWIIGLVSLAVALLVSLLLASGLLAPIERMIASVAQLSAGNYAHRMREHRRDELGQLTRDIDRLAMILEESQQARRRLMADISHELRTPLTVLSGEIEALKDGLRSFDETQLESLDQEVQRLRLLIDDLYELSVADVGGLRYQFEPMDLAQTLKEAMDSARDRASDAGLDLLLDPASAASAPLTGDARRLKQLLTNLFENALAYTDAPGRIVVTLRLEGAMTRLCIEDSAPGVNAQDCERLFEPLYRQESSRSRHSGGAGLGLAICRNIVQAHEGSINASPSSLGGVRIEIVIPLDSEHSA